MLTDNKFWISRGKESIKFVTDRSCKHDYLNPLIISINIKCGFRVVLP